MSGVCDRPQGEACGVHGHNWPQTRHTGNTSNTRDPSRLARRVQSINAGTWRRQRSDDDRDRVPIAFGAADLLRYGQQAAAVFSSPHAGRPCVAVNRCLDGSAPPPMRDGRGMAIGHRGKGPSSLAGVAEQGCPEAGGSWHVWCRTKGQGSTMYRCASRIHRIARRQFGATV
jgi:hypothetical protein